MEVRHTQVLWKGRTSGIYSCIDCDALQSWKRDNLSCSSESIWSLCVSVSMCTAVLLFITVRDTFPAERGNIIEHTCVCRCVYERLRERERHSCWNSMDQFLFLLQTAEHRGHHVSCYLIVLSLRFNFWDSIIHLLSNFTTLKVLILFECCYRSLNFHSSLT